MKRLFRCAGIIGLSAIANAIFAQDSGVIGPSPYEFTTQTWIEPFAQEGFTWGGNSGVHVESEDRIYSFCSEAKHNSRSLYRPNTQTLPALLVGMYFRDAVESGVIAFT